MKQRGARPSAHEKKMRCNLRFVLVKKGIQWTMDFWDCAASCCFFEASPFSATFSPVGLVFISIDRVPLTWNASVLTVHFVCQLNMFYATVTDKIRVIT